MLQNESRLKLQTISQVSSPPLSVINSELIKTEQSIERKWSILDDFSNCWTYTQWKDFKDSLYNLICYREYLLILRSEKKDYNPSGGLV
jgi:hypothetical protein